MKEELGTSGVVLALVILLSLFLGVAIAIYPGWERAWIFMEDNLLVSKEAPAWIQAIGSIGAILIAIWISNSSERTAKKHALINARAFASVLNSSFNAMKAAVENSEPGLVLIFQGSMNEALVSGRGIRTELLPESCISSVLSLRSIAGSILVASAVYANNPTPDGARQFKWVLNNYWVQLTKHVIELSRAHVGLPEVS